jgi:hypothetical protein
MVSLPMLNLLGDLGVLNKGKIPTEGDLISHLQLLKTSVDTCDSPAVPQGLCSSWQCHPVSL